MAVLVLGVSTARDVSTLMSRFETPGGNGQIANRICNFLTSLYSGTELALSSSVPPQIAISIRENEISATGTFSFSGVTTANDTVIVNGITFTYVASGATGNQVNRGATATDSAANLASTVNASVSSLVNGYVTASAATGVTTIISNNHGIFGNQATISKGVDAGSVITVSGARLVGGASDPNGQTLQF